MFNNQSEKYTPLAAEAIEINHVIINLENHQFHTVPSKFSDSPSAQPCSSLWPKIAPNDLETNKSFRRCLSLSSPGMMNSRMRGLRERNRPVNDYNIPKKGFESGPRGSTRSHWRLQADALTSKYNIWKAPRFEGDLTSHDLHLTLYHLI